MSADAAVVMSSHANELLLTAVQKPLCGLGSSPEVILHVDPRSGSCSRAFRSLKNVPTAAVTCDPLSVYIWCQHESYIYTCVCSWPHMSDMVLGGGFMRCLTSAHQHAHQRFLIVSSAFLNEVRRVQDSLFLHELQLQDLDGDQWPVAPVSLSYVSSWLCLCSTGGQMLTA